MNTMNKTTVRDIIKSRGTKFASVTFIKKDGSERKVNGLFRPSSHIIGNAKGRVISETMKRNGLFILSLRIAGSVSTKKL